MSGGNIGYGAGVGTLGWIKYSMTANVELHSAPGSSDYQHPTGITTNYAHETDGTWQLLPNLDLAFIKTSNTPDKQVEVYIVSSSSNYQNHITKSTTFACETSGTWQLLPSRDLAYIKTKDTAEKKVEIHIASAASGYKDRSLELITSFANDDHGVWQLLPSLDLAYIKTSETMSGYVEIFMATYAVGYKQPFVLYVTTFAPETNGTWLLLANSDLVFIKTDNTPSGRAEVHIASKSSNYENRTVELVTALSCDMEGAWGLVP